jgi:hypothetical protein
MDIEEITERIKAAQMSTPNPDDIAIEHGFDLSDLTMAITDMYSDGEDSDQNVYGLVGIIRGFLLGIYFQSHRYETVDDD